MRVPDGSDAFGDFACPGRAMCETCSKPVTNTIMYLSTPMLPKGIEVEDTVYGKITRQYTPRQRKGLKLATRPTIGINCGCYAKLHRQVAHIQDKMRQRSSQSS